MSKPFVISHHGGLRALPAWLEKQSFGTYSIAFQGGRPMLSLYMGSGRALTRMQGVLVTKDELLDEAEAIVRKHLNWEPLERAET